MSETFRAEWTREWALNVVTGKAGDGYLDDQTGPEFIGLALIYVGDAIREATQERPANATALLDAAPIAEALALLLRAVQTDDIDQQARSEQ